MKNIILIFAAVLLVGCDTNERNSVSESTVLRQTVTGSWAWKIENCGIDPQVYSFSKDGTKMFVDAKEGLILGDRDNVYPRLTNIILGESTNTLRTSIVEEDRFYEFDKKVKWDLRLLYSNQFCWHRTDWSKN